jgi:hypothetical protein
VIGELIGTFIGIMLDLPTAFKYVLSLLGMGLGWHLALTIVDRLEYR